MSKEKNGLFGRLFGASKPMPAPAPASPARSVPAPAAVWPKKTTVFSLGIQAKIGEHKIKYRYPNLEAKFNSNTYSPGVPVNLQADGTMVIFGNPAGTFNAPKIQAMLKDWYDRGDPVICKLLQINEDGSGLVYAAFYKIPHYTGERFCKVSGTGSASRQEEIGLLSEGDELYLEESVDVSGRVDVSDLGYLGTKDSAWALDELDLDFCETTVASVEENENGKLLLTVRIRY